MSQVQFTSKTTTLAQLSLEEASRNRFLQTNKWGNLELRVDYKVWASVVEMEKSAKELCPQFDLAWTPIKQLLKRSEFMVMHIVDCYVLVKGNHHDLLAEWREKLESDPNYTFNLPRPPRRW